MDIDDKSSEKSNDIFEDDSEVDSIMDTQADNNDDDDNTDDGHDTDDGDQDHEDGDYGERAWTCVIKRCLKKSVTSMKMMECQIKMQNDLLLMTCIAYTRPM